MAEIRVEEKRRSGRWIWLLLALLLIAGLVYYFFFYVGEGTSIRATDAGRAVPSLTAASVPTAPPLAGAACAPPALVVAA